MLSKDERAARKGKTAEQLIAAVCVLATGTELNALTSLVDDEGVDLAFKHRDGTRTWTCRSRRASPTKRAASSFVSGSASRPSYALPPSVYVKTSGCFS